MSAQSILVHDLIASRCHCPHAYPSLERPGFYGMGRFVTIFTAAIGPSLQQHEFNP
jgi:hypothetical protein